MGAAPNADTLTRSLLALPEIGFRLAWLREQVEAEDPRGLAEALDDLLRLSGTGAAAAREALVSVCIFLVVHRAAPRIAALRSCAVKDARLNLARILAVQTDAASPPELEMRVPKYDAGRELTVGERRSLARRPTRLQLEKLLLDPHPLVLSQLLLCPSLTETDLLRILTARPVRPAAITAVCQRPEWLARRRVRLALIQNPGCPQDVALPLVAACPRDDLAQVVKSTHLSLTVRAAAHELYLRLPPIAVETETLH